MALRRGDSSAAKPSSRMKASAKSSRTGSTAAILAIESDEKAQVPSVLPWLFDCAGDPLPIGISIVVDFVAPDPSKQSWTVRTLEALPIMYPVGISAFAKRASTISNRVSLLFAVKRTRTLRIWTPYTNAWTKPEAISS